jgi:hypothetical protein
VGARHLRFLRWRGASRHLPPRLCHVLILNSLGSERMWTHKQLTPPQGLSSDDHCLLHAR